MAVTTVQAGRIVQAGDVILNTWYLWANNQYGLFGLHFVVNLTTGPLSCGDIAYWLQNNTEPTLQDVIGIPALFLGSRAICVDPTNTNVAGVAISDGVGGHGSTLLPTQTSGIITFTTGRRGPAGRGRAFMPFPGNSAANSASGLPNSGYVDDLQLVANALLGTLTVVSQDALRSGTINPCVYHYGNANYDPITGATARSYWGTQKRRGDLGRPNPAAIPL